MGPTAKDELTVYYLFWMALFMLINIIWDMKSQITDDFHLLSLSGKAKTAFAAASFCSSLIVLMATINPATRALVGDTLVPLILAGIIGVIYSVMEICPYTKEQLQEKKRSDESNKNNEGGE